MTGEGSPLREKGANCAANAVHNGVALGSDLHRLKVTYGPEAGLRQICDALNRISKHPRCQLKPIDAKLRLDQLAWLRGQTAGAYAVEFEVEDGRLHVVTWIAAAAGASRIIETDPDYPSPLATSAAQLHQLGIRDATVKTVLKIVACKKRKRSAVE